MKIKLYKASSFKYTPFDDFETGDLDYLKANGIEITPKISEANIIISQNYKHIKKYFWRALFGRQFLIWTLESRFDTHFKPLRKVFFGLVRCHVMNVYTKDVFVTNTTFHSKIITNVLQPLPEDFKLKSRKTIALMSFYKGLHSEALLYENDNRDLIALRTEIALKGHERNTLAVYGKGWPDGISKEDSRAGDWVSRKKELLKPYHFNLSFENTAAYNYMTEKIWDSIAHYCLPIYYGKHTNAYALFPENSFLDYAKFNSPTALFDYIEAMSSQEYIERMNKCIATYNALSSKDNSFAIAERQKMLQNIVSKVTYICEN